LVGAALWAEDGHRIRLGFLVKQPEESWFQKEWEFAEEASRDLKFDLVKIAATDGEKVLTAIDNLGAQKAKGFVICAPDVRLGPAIVARARVWGMKVFAVDDQLLNSDGTPLRSVPYLGISAREIGMAVAAVCWAELLRRHWDLSETGAIAISFNELETARARLAGATTLLDAMGLPPGHIFDAPQKTTDVEGGFNAANVTITKNPRIKHWLVFALNDESVLGGVQALQGRGFQAFDIIGVGINGMAIAASELRKTNATGFFASILLDARRHGYETVAMLNRWVRDGTEPPMDTRTKGTVITRDNYVSVLTAHGLGGLLK
jgi:L-arabinose transport system substrate-binding protein